MVDTKKIESELKEIMKAEREANEELKNVWFWQQGAVQRKLDGIYAERRRVKEKYGIKTVKSDGISFTLYDGTNHKAGQKKKTKAQKREEELMVDAWNRVVKRQRETSVSGKFNFKKGDSIILCTGTYNNPCSKMRPGSRETAFSHGGCPNGCNPATMLFMTYKGKEWAKKNGYK